MNKTRPRIALYEPRIPQNTGCIGRSCLAFNLSLDIIKPIGFSMEDKYLKRAGLDYWKYVDLHLYNSLEEYLNKYRTSRLIGLTKKVTTTISTIKYKCNDILLFGREDTGLPDLVRNQCNILASIPMPGGERFNTTGAVRSLNLSVACGIVSYTACSQLNLLKNKDNQ